MRYGHNVEDGFLPVYSVETEQEAEQLIILTCSLGPDGNYYASELIKEQTLENLAKFSNKLAKYHKLLKE